MRIVTLIFTLLALLAATFTLVGCGGGGGGGTTPPPDTNYGSFTVSGDLVTYTLGDEPVVLIYADFAGVNVTTGPNSISLVKFTKSVGGNTWTLDLKGENANFTSQFSGNIKGTYKMTVMAKLDIDNNAQVGTPTNVEVEITPNVGPPEPPW